MIWVAFSTWPINLNHTTTTCRSPETNQAARRNLALTPPKAKVLAPEEVKRICHDYPLKFLKQISSLCNPAYPFRFVYTSGALAERDQSKALWLASDYRKIRVSHRDLPAHPTSSWIETDHVRLKGAVDAALVSYAMENSGRVEVQITKPGLIDHSGRGILARAALSIVAPTGAMCVHVSEIAAAELDQAIHGFDGVETVENADLVRIGRNMLQNFGRERS